MGKGSKYRPVNKKKYDKNYIKIFGIKCKKCNGVGCSVCNGLGKVERRNNGTK